MAKKQFVNMTMDADYHSHIKDHATAKGVEKVSDYIIDWLFKLGFERKDIKRVILQVPETALVSKAALETWLYNRSREIVANYFKEPSHGGSDHQDQRSHGSLEDLGTTTPDGDVRVTEESERLS